MDVLPEWQPGTAAVLVVRGPHAIPISTAVRLADDRVALALARRRETLDRLRGDPRAALVMFAPGLAFSAYGNATILREELDASSRVAALALRVERLQDHLEGARTEIVEGVRWEWTDDEAAETDAEIRAELARLA